MFLASAASFVLIYSVDASHEHFVGALNQLVDQTNTAEGGTHDVSKTIHAPMHTVSSHPWLGKYIPGLEHLAAEYHVGNFVVMRGTGEQFFESMPICMLKDLWVELSLGVC
jgi:phosphatidylserine decarboxylase